MKKIPVDNMKALDHKTSVVEPGEPSRGMKARPNMNNNRQSFMFSSVQPGSSLPIWWRHMLGLILNGSHAAHRRLAMIQREEQTTLSV
ncbi:unnamed protein product [Boreogadus saida]